MGPQVGYDPGSFYVWRASDGFAIHLSLKMVSQLAAQIARGGNENQTEDMRGILLGRTIDTPFRTTVIDDFKLIPASAAEAHPDCDDALFEIACRMAEAGTDQRALGFFRAQRHGNLNLGPRDMQTFSRLFCETGKVALLIQTPRRGGESEAALFYWQQGGAFPSRFRLWFPVGRGAVGERASGLEISKSTRPHPTGCDSASPSSTSRQQPEPVPAASVSSSEDADPVVAFAAYGCAGRDLHLGTAICHEFQPHYRGRVRTN